MTGWPAPRRVRTNGITLSVHEAGPADGVPLLLVHGWPELAYSWKPVLPALVAAGCRVIAPDLRGFGGSDAPESLQEYGIDTLVADLTGLLDALGIEQAVWAGHDWGGIIMWHAALLAPERFLGAIGVNTPHLPRGARPPTDVFRELGGEDHYIVAFQTPGEAEAKLEGREDAFFAYVFARGPRAQDMGRLPPEITHLVKNFEGFAGRPERRIAVPAADRQVYADAYRRTGFGPGIHLYRNFDANWERMGGVDHRIALPCLMVSAECDFALPPELTKWMPALCRDLERHVIPGCGHWTMWEAPETLSALMTDWIARRYPA